MAIENMVTTIYKDIMTIIFIHENIAHVLDKLLVVDTVEKHHGVATLHPHSICHGQCSSCRFLSYVTDNGQSVIWLQLLNKKALHSKGIK